MLCTGAERAAYAFEGRPAGAQVGRALTLAGVLALSLLQGCVGTFGGAERYANGDDILLGDALPVTAASSPVAAVSRAPSSDDRIADLRARGPLRVATRNAPTTWYLDRHGRSAGPEYDLVNAFAEWLGVRVELVVRETSQEVIDAVVRGDADLAAAGLTDAASRVVRLAPGPAYGESRDQLVCHRAGRRVRSRDGLEGREIVVAAGGSGAETLALLAESRPALQFDTADRSVEDLLGAVADREVDCTVADSRLVALNRRYHPALRVELDLTGDTALVWYHHPEDEALREALVSWFDEEYHGRVVADVEARYFAFAGMFDFVELRAFQRSLTHRYPRYQRLFEAAAEAYDLPADLLAAQAYQESRWNPQAVSPTGVRGIMMLTEPTARAMGVTDRRDPAQSIDGGARYLAAMRERFSDEIPDPDRLYLALAAYNIGRAHMHDAQTLVRERGGNPQSWEEVKAVLPLLADERVYPRLKYGYARGTDPVRYVERIRNFEDILRRSRLIAGR